MLYKTYFLVLGLFSLVIVFPILGIVSKIEFDLSYFIKFFNSSYNIRLIYISFIQAFLSAILSCAIGILFALSLYRHKGLMISLLIIFPKLISSFLKIVIYSLFFNRKKIKIYSQRLFGLLNSIAGKKSWYRPKI